MLDALRGFALFGICLANLTVFSGYVALPPPAKETMMGAQVFDLFLALFVDGRFYTLFSFLFGIGFALQLSRLQQSGYSSGINIYLRRLVILFLIGLLHIFILWHGDILALYALLGFVLIFFRNFSDKAVLLSAGLFLMMPVAGYLLFWQLGVDPDGGFYEVTSIALGGDGSIGYFFQGFSLNQTTNDVSVFYDTLVALSNFRVGYLIETWRIPKVLGVMLIGLWAGRKLVGGAFTNNQRLLKNTLVMGLVIAIPASIWLKQLGGLNVFSDYSTNGLLSVIGYSLAVFPMGFAYAAGFVLLWNRGVKFLSAFALAGRMALTNYLTQTVIGIVVFYGLGFGLGTQGAPFSLLGIAIAVIVVQIWYSRLWLNHFRFGPAEWIWRCLTYGKLIAIKKT